MRGKSKEIKRIFHAKTPSAQPDKPAPKRHLHNGTTRVFTLKRGLYGSRLFERKGEGKRPI